MSVVHVVLVCPSKVDIHAASSIRCFMNLCGKREIFWPAKIIVLELYFRTRSSKDVMFVAVQFCQIFEKCRQNTDCINPINQSINHKNILKII